MTTDSKLGLLAGLAAVVAVAVVYYQKPAEAAAQAPRVTAAAAVSLAPASLAPALIVTGPAPRR